MGEGREEGDREVEKKCRGLRGLSEEKVTYGTMGYGSILGLTLGSISSVFHLSPRP